MKDVEWRGSHIKVEPPKKPKKISGTYFPTVLGFDPWKSPFEAWCKNTRTYEPPFEGNKFTNAGQIIEPKVFDFLRNSMGFGNQVVTPADVYGDDYFKKTWGDFFPENPIFSGMWDALIVGDDGKIEYVVEVKTVQVDGRSGSLEQRWKGGEAPDYQALQASLYAYLLGIDKVLMVGVTLEDKKGDYEHPEQVVPSFANENVYIDEFKVSERYPDFDLMIEKAEKWWNDHVVTGISPAFDEKKDAEILKVLRTNNPAPTDDMAALIAEAEALKKELDEVAAATAPKEKRLKTITDAIKKFAMEQFRPGDKKVAVPGATYSWTVSKTESTELDKDALKADGLLEKYTRPKTSYRITLAENKTE